MPGTIAVACKVQELAVSEIYAGTIAVACKVRELTVREIYARYHCSREQESRNLLSLTIYAWYHGN